MAQPTISSFARMTRGFLVLAFVFLVGVTGYLLTGWSLLDAIYMVVITIFGVGYGEVHDLSDPRLKIFTIALIISGCSALIYILGGFFQFIAEGELNRALGKLKMTKQIRQLGDHVIVCGYGRLGRVLASDLHDSGIGVVIVDSAPERIEAAAARGYLVMQGDASHGATLHDAGLERARALCTVLPNDAMNVFITLTARALSSQLTIIARGEDPETEPKLRQAGANQVVLPSSISASQMADMIVRPAVMDYLHAGQLSGLDSDLGQLGLRMVNLELDASAEGRRVGDLEREAHVSLMVVALQRRDGALIEKPELDVELHEGDSVILMAHAEHTKDLEIRFANKRRLSYRGSSLVR